MRFKEISTFFNSLEYPKNLHDGISSMNPYKNKLVIKYVTEFFSKFYNDENERIFMVGINPGRFGGGKTGIAFTDPVNLEEKCGINNGLDKKTELSSRFIYTLIENYGGTEKFFAHFFLTALYPLALTKNGKNYNYYDSKEIWETLKPDILKTFKKQIEYGARQDVVICLGKKNEKYLKEINKTLKYFERIITLDHPRYIMQYKLKKLDEYLQLYNNVLQGNISD